MATITYVPSDAYPVISGATVEYGNGQTFDIKAALTAGGGSFTVDDSTDSGRQLRDALDRHEAVKRSGSSGPPAVSSRTISPVTALAPAGAGVRVLTSSAPGTVPDWIPPDSSDGDLKALAALPEQLLFGTFTRDPVFGTVTSASATWPDGATGTYTATLDSTGNVVSYTITHILDGVTKTLTQPTMTRDTNGAVNPRPAITVS